jgi:hypothetical protein
LSLWGEESWAITEMETKPPGSPYADYELDDDDPTDDGPTDAAARERRPP